MAGPNRVDVLRPFRRVHQHQHVVVLHLDHSGGNGGQPFRRVRAAKGKLSGHQRRDHVAVAGLNAVLAVYRGHDQRSAFAFKKHPVSGENVQAKRVHSALSFAF